MLALSIAKITGKLNNITTEVKKFSGFFFLMSKEIINYEYSNYEHSDKK